MNTNYVKVLTILIIFLLVESCNETLVDQNYQEDLELKSANINKKGYIVILNDSELNEELSNLQSFEKKQVAVKIKSAKILKRAGILEGEIEHVYGSAIKGFSVKIAPGQLKKLQNDLSVLRIEEDKIISLIQPFRGKPDKGGRNNDSSTQPPQVTPWGITRIGGSVSGALGTAWIIDTGIDLNHPDLNVNDTGLNKSFLGGKQATNPDDQNGHGTHVAGTIAAINNTIGVVGVAAGAKVVSVRVLDRRGSGTISGVIAGINYVAANAQTGDVANMSLGGGTSVSLDEAVLNASTALGKDIYFVLAAGNERDNANNHSPARVNGKNIFTISAMSEGDIWASYSNYGNPPIDFCAPGSGIKSTWKNGDYNTISGTSMATPHVAGLLLSGWEGTSLGTVSGDKDNSPDPIAHR